MCVLKCFSLFIVSFYVKSFWNRSPLEKKCVEECDFLF